MWARTASSGPNKLWIKLWCVWLHKTYRTILLKNPSQNMQMSITFLWRRSRKIWDGPAHFCFLRRTQKCLGLCCLQDLSISQQYTIFSPTNQLTNIPEHVQAPSPATGRKVKSMSTPGRIKFDPDYNLFPETCKNLGASQLWMLGKASTWSAYSGKQSCPAEHIFVVIHHHSTDQKLRYYFWSENSWRWKDCEEKGLFSSGSKYNLRLQVFDFFWGLSPLASPLFRKFLKLPMFQATKKVEDVQSTDWLPGPPHISAQRCVGAQCAAQWWPIGHRTEMWTSCPSAASMLRALPIMIAK